jgi:tRNA G26 N,N-dimethylase Trm1
MYKTAVENGINITYHVAPAKKNFKGYYSELAKYKREEVCKYIQTIDTKFVYVDAFCSTGIMSLYVRKYSIFCTKVISNDKYVDSNLVAYNYFKNGLLPQKISKLDCLNLNIDTSATILLDLDPYGSCKPYYPLVKRIAPLYCIFTHTDLINLCSKRGSTIYFNFAGLHYTHTSVYYELSIRSLQYLIYLDTNLHYSLDKLIINKKYLTLCCKKVDKLEYGIVYFCYCGLSNSIYFNCPICNKTSYKVGPICLDSRILKQIGGFNKNMFMKFYKVNIKHSLLKELGLQLSAYDNVFKGYNNINELISLILNKVNR